MNIEDLILEAFETEDVTVENLYEGFLPITPALAFLTFKRNILGNLRKGGKDIDDALKNDANKVKSSALIAKEKARAAVGKSSGVGEDATVYKLTTEQKEILSQIHEKYGNKIIDDVMKFRKNILAPYQLIKRMVKSNKTVTSKDKFGMTHAQFKAAVESGKKKIEKRGGFFDNQKEKEVKLRELEKAIKDLEELEDDFLETGKLKETVVNRVLKNYNLDGSEFDDLSLEDMRQTLAQLKKNTKLLTRYSNRVSDGEPLTPEDGKEINNLVKRNIELRKGSARKERLSKERLKNVNNLKDEVIKEDTERDKEQKNINDFPELKRNGNFNAAFGKYLLRRNIINQLRAEENNEVKKLYVTIIREMIKEARDRIKRLSSDKLKEIGKVEFNDIERKIFKLKPSAGGSQYSGNVDDYIQVVKDEDFTDPKYIKRPDKVIEAEKKIEAEIKKFERALKKELDPEDYQKLKDYRLINNLITVKELKSPKNLFKTPKEIKKNPKTKEKEEV